jgi:hypothetical protein
MQRTITLLALFTVFSVLALAETFTGKLVDADCYNQQKGAAACDPTSSTGMFALLVSNNTAYALDTDGNSKAAEALKSRADRSTDPTKPPSGPVMAKITGSKDGTTLKVEKIDIQ